MSGNIKYALYIYKASASDYILEHPVLVLTEIAREDSSPE